MPVYRLNVQVTSPSLPDPGINTWHARTDTAGSGAEGDLQSLTDALQVFYNDIVDDFASGTTVSTDAAWVRVDDPDPDVVDVTGWSESTAAGAGPLPPSNCVVVGWRTASPTRAGMGRNFFGPMSTNALDSDGTVDAAVLVDFRDAAAALVAASAAVTGAALGVYSRKNNVLRDFTGARVRDKFAVLRSRRD